MTLATTAQSVSTDDGALRELERRVSELERLLAPVTSEPEACRARTCTYFEFYLAQGPAELVHEGYHSAERRCTAAQAGAEKHIQEHAEHCGEDCSSYRVLERIATRWETAVRA